MCAFHYHMTVGSQLGYLMLVRKINFVIMKKECHIIHYHLKSTYQYLEDFISMEIMDQI